MNAATMQVLVNASVAPEVHLPNAKPLTLTRNFGWVFAICVASLFSVPFAIAWTASLILK